MSGTHIAALFETTEAARAAEKALVAAGVEPSRILLLDRGHHDTPKKQGLWAILKHVFVPDDDAHEYAEGIVRGHPLLIADVTDAEQAAALAAVEAAHPIDIDGRAQAWRDEGWDGTSAAAPDDFVNDDFLGSASSEGELRRSDLVTGDYGSVGAPLGAGVDISILHGKTFGGGDRSAVRTGEGDNARVYTVD